jgi:hypothetical protein
VDNVGVHIHAPDEPPHPANFDGEGLVNDLVFKYFHLICITQKDENN